MEEGVSFSVLEVICRAAKKLRRSRLSKKALEGMSAEIKKGKDYLGVTEMQTVLFLIIYAVNYTDDESAKLSDIAQYVSLADKFEFSGGEIDNVVRKMTIEQIIKGTEISLAADLRINNRGDDMLTKVTTQ